MRRCVFHIGMSKTGSTSIQTFLSEGLRDPRFRYLGLGQANGSNALCTLFADNPEQFWCYTSGQLKARHINRYRAVYLRRLQRELQVAYAQGVCPVLSGEECWRFSRDELIRVQQMLASYGYEVQILVYLRPYAQWLESGFQQWVQWGAARDFSALLAVSGRAGISRLDYYSRLQIMADVFGRSSLLVRPFTPAALGVKGVVSDFCAAVGIETCGYVEHRANQGLSLDAIRVFYAVNNHLRQLQPWSLLETGALARYLAAMPGPPLRFCPSLLAPIAPALEHQHQILQHHYGVNLGEALPSHAAEERVSSEGDLLRFSPAALAWLAAGLGGGMIALPPTSPAAVAAWVDRRRGRLLRRHVTDLARERLGQVWHLLYRPW
ncbi:MAG: hypothetical protein VKN13_00585 [Cyanobacteriota bacterium]|nr:hypothetical protein [Cyanobacteriota bacterium]